MPSFPPRDQPVKKAEELLKREKELMYAIGQNLPIEKLNIVVEKYRKAQLSLLKAKVHGFKERDYQNKPQINDLIKLEDEIQGWKTRTGEEILDHFINSGL